MSNIKVDEQTEIRVPLKTLVMVIAGLLTASWYVFTTQQRIHSLETSQLMMVERFDTYAQQPGRSHTDVELIKKDIEFIKQILAINAD